jgi:2-isopropylmalate synthase
VFNNPPGPDPANDVIYDWNLVDSFHQLHNKKVELLDETLRDGLQSAYVTHPHTGEKAELLRLMDAIGIDVADIGLPGASDEDKQDVIALARVIADEKLRVRPAAAARTHQDDIRHIVEASQASGMPIEVMAFIGSSPIRMYAEEWDLPFLLDRSRKAIEFARREGLPVTFVTEDTTRSRPDILHRLFATAIEAGAQRICLCDTVGHSTPDGIRSLLRFIWNLLRGLGVEVGVDWHGHNDRGIALSNSMWALQWGADRLHGCALGVGERSGNCSMDRLIMNLRLLGTFGEERDLSGLLAYCECASRILHHPIAVNYPLAGRDAFRTQSGVHAAAILKARRKGETHLADRIYSGVPAGMFGRQQEVVIGPMSGASNVTQYCDAHAIACDAKGIATILDYAKAGTHILTEDEVRAVLRESRTP